MNSLHILIQFLRREDGVTSVEYCVMLAFILVVVIIGVTTVGDGAAGLWVDIDSDLNTHDF
jgi:Flp pilus assembly pilin Flp